MAALDQEPAEDAGVEGFLQLVLTRTPGSPEGPGGSGPDVVELGTQEYMMLTEPTAPLEAWARLEVWRTHGKD